MEDFIAAQEIQNLSAAQIPSTSHGNLFTIQQNWIPAPMQNVNITFGLGTTNTDGVSSVEDQQARVTDVRCQGSIKVNDNVDLACKACEKTFNSLTSLNRHVKRMHNSMAPEETSGEYTHLCGKCGKVYNSKTHLKAHEESVHLKKLHKCKFCDAAYKWKCNLGVHMQQKHYTSRPARKRNIRRKCKPCSLEFATNKLYDKHMSEIHGVQFTCKLCDSVFDMKYLYDQHMLSNHRGVGSKFQCVVCKFGFKWESGLEKHVEVYGHAPAIEIKDMETGIIKKCYKCKQCASDSNVFETATSFQEHLQKSHKNVIQKNPKNAGSCSRSRLHTTCNICHKTFRNKVAYRAHQKTHRTCSICGYESLYPADVRKHMLVHTGEKPYKCRICARGFRDPSGRKSHERRHTKTYRHTCDICQKGFYKQNDFEDHMLTHKEPFPFECQFCSKRYKHRKIFDTHVKKVHKEKSETDTPYHCITCGDRFATEELFKEHNDQAHRDDFVCNVCRQKLSSKKELDDHYTLAHLKKWLQFSKQEHICTLCSGKCGSTESFSIHCMTHLQCSPYECANCKLELTVKESFMKHLEVKHPAEYRMISEEVQDEMKSRLELAKKVASKLGLVGPQVGNSRRVTTTQPTITSLTCSSPGQEPTKVIVLTMPSQKATVSSGSDRAGSSVQVKPKLGQAVSKLMLIKPSTNQSVSKPGLALSNNQAVSKPGLKQAKKLVKSKQSKKQTVSKSGLKQSKKLSVQSSSGGKLPPAQQKTSRKQCKTATKSKKDVKVGQVLQELVQENDDFIDDDKDTTQSGQEHSEQVSPRASGKKTKECPFCESKFRTINELKAHHVESHEEDFEIYRQCLTLRIQEKDGVISLCETSLD